jgi:hypothetical protein
MGTVLMADIMPRSIPYPNLALYCCDRDCEREVPRPSMLGGDGEIFFGILREYV